MADWKRAWEAVKTMGASEDERQLSAGERESRRADKEARRKRFGEEVEAAKREKEATKREQAMRLGAVCRYLGGSLDVPGIVRGKRYEVHLSSEGLALTNALFTKKFRWDLPWEEVHEAQCEDASEVRQQTKVRYHQEGGLLGNIFKSYPVPDIQSKTQRAALLAVDSTHGEFLLQVETAGRQVEGVLLSTKPMWSKRVSAVEPMEQLEKLGSLRDAGILTDAEFESKKAEILDRI